jgi:predicted RNase H-like HicB family nuclease
MKDSIIGIFKYSVQLSWSDEDECYIATIKEFPGLSAFGDTPEEAAHEARIAAEGMIEDLKEDGEDVPEPVTLRRIQEAESNRTHAV